MACPFGSVGVAFARGIPNGSRYSGGVISFSKAFQFAQSRGRALRRRSYACPGPSSGAVETSRGRRSVVSGMRVIGLAGWSGAGKTNLLVRAIPVLVARGVKVATLKHAHHDFDTGWPGKDSYEHRRAGACEVLVSSGRRWAQVHELRDEPEATLGQLLRRISPCDLIVVEGYKREPIPKIEVRGPRHRGHRKRRRISGLGHSRRRFEQRGGGDGPDARRGRRRRRRPREALAGWPSSATTASRSVVL
jgi:molybdopterin-guanine dinucleotide biosynthesis protein MobB